MNLFTVHRRSADQRDDQGFILVTLGLLLIPIMVFSALAVDVSSWYSRASDLQKAADSASLAGVVWMPNLATASGPATASLANHGIINGSGDVSVTIQPGAEANSLRVCITDNSAPQYFAAVFTSPQTLTRCATAQYNVPLQLGSPLNYFGGNTDLAEYVSGPTPSNALVEVPPNSVFGASNFCQVRESYPSGVSVGYWDRNGSTNDSNWDYRARLPGWAMANCNTAAPAIPDYESFNPVRFCYLRSGSTPLTYWDNQNSSNPSDWYYRNRPGSNSSRPNCGYGGSSQQPIPAEKSPGMWAAVLGPNNSRANGDIYSTTNGDYRPTGYWYSVDIPDTGVASGGVSIQVFDGSTNCEVGCRSPMGDNSGPSMAFAVYDSNTTPYDMSDDTLLCSTTIANNPSWPDSDTYNVRWAELCNIGAPVNGRRYYINVRSTGGSNYNGYALRAVAGTYPAACMVRMPVADVNCYGAPGSVQPALSAYGDMEMYNGITAGTPTKFFLANVKKVYAGKTLRIGLWDPGDGNGNISVKILKPGPAGGSHEVGVVVPECSWRKITQSGTLQDSGTLSGPEGCKKMTTVSSTMEFQDRWVEFRINIPDSYDCDDTVDPMTASGSCWWQIEYETTQSTSDYTTWEAEIIGDPVRLTQ